MGKILCKEEEPQEYLGITPPAGMLGIARIVFLTILVSGNILVPAKSRIDL